MTWGREKPDWSGLEMPTKCLALFIFILETKTLKLRRGQDGGRPGS